MPEGLQQGAIPEAQEKDTQIQIGQTTQVVVPVPHVLVDGSATSKMPESKVQSGMFLPFVI